MYIPEGPEPKTIIYTNLYNGLLDDSCTGFPTTLGQAVGSIWTSWLNLKSIVVHPDGSEILRNYRSKCGSFMIHSGQIFCFTNQYFFSEIRGFPFLGYLLGPRCVTGRELI